MRCSRVTSSRAPSRTCARRSDDYTTFRPEVLGEASSSDSAALRVRRRTTRGTAVRRKAKRRSSRVEDCRAARRIKIPIRYSMRCAWSRARAKSRSSRGDAITGPPTRATRRGAGDVTSCGGRRVRVQEAHGAWAVAFRADRDRRQHLGTALPPQHHEAAGRRPRAVRLRARLQVLPVRRDASSPPTARSPGGSASSTPSTCGCIRR